jgi:hypothetical protein
MRIYAHELEDRVEDDDTPERLEALYRDAHEARRRRQTVAEGTGDTKESGPEGRSLWSGLARAEGLEPPTPGFGDQCSAN